MFQAWEVKTAKMAASSKPRALPGKRPERAATLAARKPRMGTDCRMSKTAMRKGSSQVLAAKGRRPG
jgi:hypothetical protein